MRLGTYYRYQVIKSLNLPISGYKVLDIGCHDGFLLSKLSARVKAGIDINPIKKFPNIEYIKNGFLEHDFKNTKFDMIFFLDVLEHCKEGQNYFRKILDILSPYGLAIISTPSKSIRIFPPFLQRWVDKKWDHIYCRGYTSEELVKMNVRIGKGRINIIKWNCPFFRLFYLPLSLSWRISSAITKQLLNIIIKIDYKFQNGTHGFYYVTLRQIQ